MATTIAYATERIYELLVDGNGSEWALSVANRFVRGDPPGFSNEMRATRAKLKPAIYVAIVSGDLIPAGIIGDSHTYVVKISIFRDHWLGFEGDPAEVKAQQDAATDAHFRMGAVLAHPANLEQTQESNATGFTNALNDGGFKLLRVANLGDNNRLLSYVDTFTAGFDYSPSG